MGCGCDGNGRNDRYDDRRVDRENEIGCGPRYGEYDYRTGRNDGIRNPIYNCIDRKKRQGKGSEKAHRECATCFSRCYCCDDFNRFGRFDRFGYGYGFGYGEYVWPSWQSGRVYQG